MAAVAGLVPCAESGMSTFLRAIAAGFEAGAHHQDAGQLALGSGGGLQRDGIHAGNLQQRLAELLHDAQGSAGERLGLQRVPVSQPFQPRDELIDARVVLHRAGTQGIESAVDAVVPGAQARIVADDFQFTDFGEVRNVFPNPGQNGAGVHGGYVQRRQLVAVLSRRGDLEDQVLVLNQMTGGAAVGFRG